MSNNPTYIDSMNLFGCHVKQIPCIVGEGSPTTDTYGAIGCLYMDTSSSKGDMYKCININDGKYTWVKMIENTNEDSGQNPSQGGGMSAAAASLLITILRDCATYSPQTANIDALEALLTAGAAPDAPPHEGVTQTGSVLTITSGVTVTQDGNALNIA